MKMFVKGLPILAMSVAGLTAQLQAQEMPAYEVDRSMLSEKYKGKSYSPYASRDFPWVDGRFMLSPVSRSLRFISVTDNNAVVPLRKSVTP